MKSGKVWISDFLYCFIGFGIHRKFQKFREVPNYYFIIQSNVIPISNFLPLKISLEILSLYINIIQFFVFNNSQYTAKWKTTVSTGTF